MTRNQEIAQIILEQLGGNKFLVMTGSKVKYCGDNNGNSYIMFSLTKNLLHAQFLKITLTAMDDYTMQFSKIKRTLNKDLAKLGIKIYDEEHQILKTIEGVYCDMLQDIFEEQTGLYTTLFARQ